MVYPRFDIHLRLFFHTETVGGSSFILFLLLFSWPHTVDLCSAASRLSHFSFEFNAVFQVMVAIIVGFLWLTACSNPGFVVDHALDAERYCGT